jgi:hypothetical protein
MVIAMAINITGNYNDERFKDFAVNNYSYKQLCTIANFGNFAEEMHVGVMGCGKTYSIMEGLGTACYKLQKNNLTGFTFILAAKTLKMVKANMGNPLSDLFGSNFKYTSSLKDGHVKDAILFGQYLRFIGLNDAGADQRFIGLSNVLGVIHDEARFATEEQVALLMTRARGTLTEEVERALEITGMTHNFYIGATNPDAPTHWIKQKIDNGRWDNLVIWNINDAKWKGAEEYYRRNIKRMKGLKTLEARNLRGEWVGKEGMAWESFGASNIVDNDIPFDDCDFSASDRVIIGIDWGSKHESSISILTKQGRIYTCVYNFNYSQMAPSQLAQIIVKMIGTIEETHAVNAIYVDGAGKAYNDELRRLGISVILADKKDRDNKVETVDSGFYNETLFVANNCEKLINSIYSYCYDDNGKLIRVDDDACDSLRYAYTTDVQLTEV